MPEDASSPPSSKLVDGLHQAIASGGREIERSLQIATGALCLAVLSALPSMWQADIISPEGGLRIAYMRFLAGAGTAFMFSVLATSARITMFAPVWGRSTALTKWMDTWVWSLAFMACVVFMVVSSYNLIHQLKDTTSDELAAIEREGYGYNILTPTTGFPQLEQRRHAIIRDKGDTITTETGEP